MRTPENLETLVDHGIIQEVVRPLMSGKEAQIYLVVAGGEECVAKVYKEAIQRSFKHRVEYTEGRRATNSRDRRAMDKRTRYGRKQDEAAWRSTEVDMIFRLRDAGVRVPEPINFVDGVLVMELVKDAEGNPAPRLGDLSFEASEAREIYQELIREAVRMLCAGVIHGDLSEFNVLMGANGPVLIDFPQSVDSAHNQSARKLLLRDVENLHRFVAGFAPEQPRLPYAEEMWALYESNRLRPDTKLRGDYQAPEGIANTEEVLALIDDAKLDEQARREARGVDKPLEGVGAPKPLRKVRDFTKVARPRSGARRTEHPETLRSRSREKPVPTKSTDGEACAAPNKRRNRRRRKSGASAGRDAAVRISRIEPAKTDTKTATPGEENGPRRRRRRGRGKRTSAEGAKAATQGGAKRPTNPREERRGDSGQGETARPSRPRRRSRNSTPKH